MTGWGYDFAIMRASSRLCNSLSRGSSSGEAGSIEKGSVVGIRACLGHCGQRQRLKEFRRHQARPRLLGLARLEGTAANDALNL
jgi:hypothetical protein